MTTAYADPPDLVFTIIDLLSQPKQITRAVLVDRLTKQCCTEDTAHLVDHLEDAWATLDMLQRKVGTQRAAQLLLCEFYTQRYSSYLDQGACMESTPIPPHIIAQVIVGREAQHLLCETLDLMGLLKAGEPVTPGWITVRDSLRQEAESLFSTVTQETPDRMQDVQGEPS